MKTREEIIEKVTELLRGNIENDVISTVQDALTIVLYNYEIQKRCTEISVVDNTDKLLKRFIATKRIEGLSEKTIQRYVYINQKLFDFIRKPIEEITAYDIRFYLAHKRQNDNISNRTLDGMRRCYSSFFTWFVHEGFLSENPCLSIKAIKSSQTIKKPFSAEEIERLRRVCDNKRDIALIDFLYSTGCRVSEVVSLNINDIDFQNFECTVLGKGNKERTVYITEVAMLSLKEYLVSRKDTNTALFLGKGNQRLGKNGIEALLRKLGNSAKIENVHPHRYRRTLATNLLDKGMSIQDVAIILGHSDLKTTQIYCYVNQSNVRNSYFRLAI